MSISNTVYTYLSDHNIHYDLLSHKKTNSSLETARRAYVDERHIAKAVVVEDSKGYAMVVLPAGEWLKLISLRKTLNRDFKLVAESVLKQLFSDCQAGAIPPLGQAYHLDTYLDGRLNYLTDVYLEAGDHRHLLHIDRQQFHHLFKGVRHCHFCHLCH
ncbi:MAG: YbaK/EbsC family protein [Gammaproteobacteria bacterium]|nr:YbaK/EbsC family protein [Gammaproteobacteria bacterium]